VCVKCRLCFLYYFRLINFARKTEDNYAVQRIVKTFETEAGAGFADGESNTNQAAEHTNCT